MEDALHPEDDWLCSALQLVLTTMSSTHATLTLQHCVSTEAVSSIVPAITHNQHAQSCSAQHNKMAGSPQGRLSYKPLAVAQACLINVQLLGINPFCIQEKLILPLSPQKQPGRKTLCS